MILNGESFPSAPSCSDASLACIGVQAKGGVLCEDDLALTAACHVCKHTLVCFIGVSGRFSVGLVRNLSIVSVTLVARVML